MLERKVRKISLIITFLCFNTLTFAAGNGHDCGDGMENGGLMGWSGNKLLRNRFFINFVA